VQVPVFKVSDNTTWLDGSAVDVVSMATWLLVVDCPPIYKLSEWFALPSSLKGSDFTDEGREEQSGCADQVIIFQLT
jgi:hypothetical protein